MLATAPTNVEIEVGRLWRWCIARTIRDLRESARRGRPISLPNLRRLFQRRWSDAAGASPAEEQLAREAGGCSIIQSLYTLELRFALRRAGNDPDE